VSWRRILGLALAAVALALVVWGLFFAKTIVSIKIDLPPAQPSKPAEPKPVDVYLHGDGSVWVGDKPSSLDRLVGDIVAQAGSPDKDLQRILVHENVEVPQDVYRAVMDRINAAGWRRIELDTRRGDPRPAARR
jgi:biopolymer transport protein ExbD